MQTKTKYRTNSNHVRLQVRQHIINVVKDEDNCENINTIEGASQIILESFNDWDCDYERKRTPNNQDRFSDWLLALPFDFEYTYYGIEQFLNGLGINPEGEEFDTDKSRRLYHYLIWSEIQKATS